MKPLSGLFTVMLFIIVCTATTEARKVKLQLKPPQSPETVVTSGMIEVTADSATSAPYSLTMISFSGYDKEAPANVESFFITNNTDRTLKSLTLTIRYRTLDGRSMHSRNVTLSLDIEPGATARADIKSWDLQHTFYYHRGNRPRKKATPYEVAFHVDSFTLAL